jgi:opacity protein-like surface antigen
MHRAATVLLALVASCASTPNPVQNPPAQITDRSSKLSLSLGVRSLDQDDWSPVDDQGVIGLEFVHEDPGSAVGFEVGLFGSGKTKENVPVGGGGTIDVRGRTREISAGVHKTFSAPGETIHPYVGAGLAAIRAELRGNGASSSAEDDDRSGGLYVHGGVDFDIGQNLFLGVDLRLLGGTDITLFGANGTADYAQLALVFGVGF